MTITAPTAAGTPVPSGRARWQLSLLRRPFGPGQHWSTLMIADLGTARSRRLEKTINSPATLTFTIDGHDPAAAAAVELATEVLAWRWDETSGGDVPMFRGPITQSEDQVTEQAHTVNLTCWDYGKILERRILTNTWTATGMEQDTIVQQMLILASAMTTSNPPPGGTSLAPGSFLPVRSYPADGTGATRAASGQARDRTYTAGAAIGGLLDDLAKVINGYDYDILPLGASPGPTDASDWFRVFYPAQGTTRTSPELIYGSSVAALSRSTSSADFGNYWRVIGQSDESQPQLFAEAWDPAAAGGAPGSPGLWMSVDNAPDVTIQSTLDQQAQGNLDLYGSLIPTYSLTLRPGFYSYGNPAIGDVVPLFVRSGRLDVATSVRVVGITYAIGDDGDENVEITVGRPPQSFAELVGGPRRDINALVRR